MVGYANVTLASSALSAVVFAPGGYYRSTRFDWSSMVACLRTGSHELFGRGLWRVPHDPLWPEAGVGLASEFGCGDDGDKCAAASWASERDAQSGEREPIVNGVLGYEEAADGEPFLKIGVGALVKGSCASCDVGGAYKFNDPYKFHSEPRWDCVSIDERHVVYEHEAQLGAYGYRLRRKVSVEDPSSLTTTTELTNLGSRRLRTPYYSHNFLSVDETPIGARYSLQIPLRSAAFSEPGNGTWSFPFRRLGTAREAAAGEGVDISLDARVPAGARIKLEFARDDLASASYTANFASDRGRVTLIRRGVLDPLFAFNVYAEATTLSPEPIMLIDLLPGETAEWTDILHVLAHDDDQGALQTIRRTWAIAMPLVLVLSLGVTVIALVRGPPRQLPPRISRRPSYSELAPPTY